MRTSRATIVLSAIDGQPPKPSSAATAPSCAWPPRDSVGSSQCSAIGRPSGRAYCRARRSSPALHTGRPSSVNPAAPRSARSPSSASCSPCWPTRHAGQEADAHDGLLARPLERGLEHRRRCRSPGRCWASRGRRSSRRRPPRGCPSPGPPSTPGRAPAGARAGRRRPAARPARRRRPPPPRAAPRRRRRWRRCGRRAPAGRGARRAPRRGRRRRAPRITRSAAGRRALRERAGHQATPAAAVAARRDGARSVVGPRDQVVEHGHAHHQPGLHLRAR